jgi:hypothetical protein
MNSSQSRSTNLSNPFSARARLKGGSRLANHPTTAEESCHVALKQKSSTIVQNFRNHEEMVTNNAKVAQKIIYGTLPLNARTQNCSPRKCHSV